MKFHLVIALFFFGLSGHPSVAQEADADAAKLEFFEKRIRPRLVEHCYECHSTDADEIGGNLLLDSRSGVRQGGDLGPALVAGDPEKSLLFAAMQHDDLEMPPSGKLDKSILDDFEKWIRDGAVDPRQGKKSLERAKIDIEQGKKFWSFQPLADPLAGVQSDDAQPVDRETLQPIDELIMRKLAPQKLKLSRTAESHDLLVRIYFDLTGLPPSPKTQKDFVDGKISLEMVVDDLLSSRHFGERMARRWLDVARYADSSGGGRVLLFPDAWRYRDYVVNAFKNDKPFDQFVIEQIAGDLMPWNENSQRAEQLTATGFLMLGAHNYELQDKELLRMEVVDEQINVVSKAFLGLTLSCARCHDHKFDPIPTEDYYALAGIFRSTKSLLPGNVSKFVTTAIPLPPEQQDQLTEYNEQRGLLQNKINEIQSAIAQAKRSTLSFNPQRLDSFPGVIIDEENAKQIGNWTPSTSVKPFINKGYHHSPDKSASMRFNLACKKQGRYELRAAYTASNNRSSKAKYTVSANNKSTTVTVDQRKQPPLDGHFVKLMTLDLKPGDEVTVLLQPGNDGTTIADAIHLNPINVPNNPQTGSRERQRREKLKQLGEDLKQAQSELKQLGPPPATAKVVMSVQEQESTNDFHVCIRGDVHSPGQKVSRGGLQVIGGLDSFQDLKGSGRLELAKWIASENNPLTARVYANRVWYWLLGKGLVGTPDNFGATGQKPVNKELLDYLALQLVRSNWSTKKLVKQIVLSRTYQQSVESDNAKIDSGNNLFSFHPRKRLDAESIRDRMLSFSGVLDDSFGGKSIKPGTKKEFGYRYDSNRRSIYLPVFRNTLCELFTAFDFPNPNLVSGKRNTSILPTQALFLMNSEFVSEQAELAARRITSQQLDSFGEQLRFAYRHSVSRAPSANEASIARKFFRLPGKDKSPPIVDEILWRSFCQLLMSSIDFRYLK